MTGRPTHRKNLSLTYAWRLYKNLRTPIENSLVRDNCWRDALLFNRWLSPAVYPFTLNFVISFRKIESSFNLFNFFLSDFVYQNSLQMSARNHSQIRRHRVGFDYFIHRWMLLTWPVSDFRPPRKMNGFHGSVGNIAINSVRKTSPTFTAQVILNGTIRTDVISRTFDINHSVWLRSIEYAFTYPIVDW